MKYLTSKLHSLRLTKTLLSVFFLTVFALIAFINTNTVSAQTVDTLCIARELSSYMNDVVEAKNSGAFSNRIQLASPIFNLTNPAEAQIFNEMSSNFNANFGGLNAWAGNTYTTYPNATGDFPDNTAYGHFVANGWEANFKLNKPIFFTEFGELNNDYQPNGKRPSIGNMQSEFQKALTNPLIQRGGIAYFNPFLSNPDPNFTRHYLTDQEFSSITGGSPLAGANSASIIRLDSGFLQEMRNHYPNSGVAVEIIDGQDPSQVAKVAYDANRLGIKLFLRLCIGDSCSYADSSVLISFLNQLDQAMAKLENSSVPSIQIWVSTGPNEPATEYWAAPNCKPIQPFDVERKIPCNESPEPQFHSLRPYPTSPCNDNPPTVYMCAKDFVVKQDFKFTRGDFGFAGGNCTNTDGGSHCEMEIDVSAPISLSLSSAEFPIMGNTELVKNSTRDSSSLTFLRRVNDYVSWYLNGTTLRAEEEDELVSNKPIPPRTEEQKQERIDEVINLSGPLKKLLPFAVQTGDYNEVLGVPLGVKTRGVRMLQQSQAGNTRHDQVVVCTAGLSFFPRPCYDPITRKMKNLSYFNFVTIYNNLFSFVPLSSTEDLPGKTTNLAPVGQTGPDAFVEGPTVEFLEGQNDTKTLYFSHVEESVQLGKLLQKTYLPSGDTGVGGAPLDQYNEQLNSPYCEIVETRSNPGDSLYGDLERDGEVPISATLKYKAKFSCDFGLADENDDRIPGCIQACQTPPGRSYGDCLQSCREILGAGECTRGVIIPLKFGVNTPKADEIWDRFVAGDMAIFKRIYPKVGPNTPVTKILDIPAETSATYQSETGISSAGTIQNTQALAGDPFKNNVGSGTLYFPHIGSVEDYFLKGIQTALRPKGVSESSEEPGTTPPEPPTTQVNCQNVPDSALPSFYLGSFKENAIRICNEWDRRGQSNGATCYNDVVSRALTAGINPTFALAIWAHESACSNYTASSLAWEDFGIHTAGNPEDFQSQITGFLSIWSNSNPYEASYPACFTSLRARGWTDMQIAMEIFWKGSSNCQAFSIPSYFNEIAKSSWSYLTNCPMPSNPTDKSCQP